MECGFACARDSRALKMLLITIDITPVMTLHVKAKF